MFPFKLSERELGQLLALLLVLGYIDINVVTFRGEQFSFVVRGPLFSRLTSGTPKYLRAPANSPEGGLTARIFVQIEAMLAFLLFTGQAYVQNHTVVGAGIVFSIQSQWFHLKTLQRILEQRKHNPMDKLVLALLNLGVGLGLMQNTFAITGTAYRPFTHHLGFSMTSNLLASSRSQNSAVPGLTAIPKGGPTFKWFNRVVGFLMVIQQLGIYSVSVGKGGRLVLGVTGDVLALKAFPQIIEKWRQG